MHIFGIHQAMYAALASRITDFKYCYRKSKSFQNITFSPKIYNSVAKNPKILSKFKKI